MTLSIIVAAFGILIIIKPFQESQISHVIIGCGFFAEGFMNHLTVKETVKISKQIQGQEKNEEATEEAASDEKTEETAETEGK